MGLYLLFTNRTDTLYREHEALNHIFIGEKYFQRYSNLPEQNYTGQQDISPHQAGFFIAELSNHCSLASEGRCG